MWTRIIIIEPPGFDDLARFRQVEEDVFVQAFVPEPAVKAFDESVLDRFARLDIMPGYTARNPPQDGHTSQFAAVVRQEAVMADD
jgi:hypothetical protein